MVFDGNGFQATTWLSAPSLVASASREGATFYLWPGLGPPSCNSHTQEVPQTGGGHGLPGEGRKGAVRIFIN